MSKNENGSVVQAARLCHVVKQENFDGYGFNLHAEKGKPGQYIGKVDDGSPAESAGLKQGDRILEVNGSSILNETHKQVVQRIKAIANEVQLLVIDPSVSPASIKKEMIKSGNEAADKLNKINNGSSVKSTEIPQTSSSPVSNHEPSSMDIIPTKSVGMPIEITVETASNDGSNKSENEHVSSSITDNNHDNHSIPDSPISAKSTSETNNSATSTTVAPSVATATMSSTPASTTGTTPTLTPKSEGLNLNMTAAELRAKLAAKKKFDPKNESVDLRKKFEIIQKL